MHGINLQNLSLQAETQRYEVSPNKKLGVMRRVYAFVLALAAICDSALAWEPFTDAAEQQMLLDLATSRTFPKAADALSPGGEFLYSDWSRDCVAAYEIQPSFDPAARWCLLEVERMWVLRSFVADKPLVSGDRPKFVAKPDRVVSVDIASAIHEVWINAVLDSRYPRYELRGLDGENHYFLARRFANNEQLLAQVWSPKADLPPLWLAEAGEEILGYASDRSANNAALAAYIGALRSRLFQYYRDR